ncbi:MAG TPA: polysaccharide lyase family 7 protein, partial [Candidatus Acidoferrales bacterium]|nr:polysaccharide lyase family 7 protein [Candidatus Acidoferrales bacterium]
MPPGTNFNLNLWELQEPIGSPGNPQTDTPAQLSGGYTDPYFLTDPTNGSMEFVDPSNGVTTAHSVHARSELREMYNATTPA